MCLSHELLKPPLQVSIFYMNLRDSASRYTVSDVVIVISALDCCQAGGVDSVTGANVVRKS